MHQRLVELVPTGVVFMGSSPEGVEYENLCRAFRDLVHGLPPIDGWTITDFPIPLDAIAQSRFDAQEIGEIEAIVSIEAGVVAPGEAIREYRYRFSRQRSLLVRKRVEALLEEIPARLASVVARVERDNNLIVDPDWDFVVEAIREVERLTGSSMTRTGRWGDLHNIYRSRRAATLMTSPSTTGHPWSEISAKPCMANSSRYRFRSMTWPTLSRRIPVGMLRRSSRGKT